jgi:hypothetical protein
LPDPLPGYDARMSTLLDDAVEAVRRLPPEDQEAIARAMIRLAGSDDSAPYPLSDEERAAIARSKAAAARGDFATEEEVRAVWAKHGL